MKSKVLAALLIPLCLSACDKSNDAVPSGQVVATVDGEEITQTELMAEVGPDGAGNAQLQAAALQRIVARRLLAAEARKRGLDSSPLAAIMKRGAEDEALSKVLAKSITNGAPAVSQAEIDEFIRTYPATIAQRRILTIDQITVPGMPKPILEEIKQLHSIGDAEAALQRGKVDYKKANGTLDAMILEPSFAAKIVDTEGRDIFIYPEGSGYLIGAVTSSRIDPITGKAAQDAARTLLSNKRRQDLLAASVGKVLKDGQSKVKINPSMQAKPAKK